MTRMFKCLAGSLASGAVLALLCMPANAAGISIGGVGGVSVGGGSASANVGGSGTPANGSANASIGDNSANATASIGSSGVTPAVGGTNGVANVTLGTDNATAAVGTGTNLGVGVGVGTAPPTIGTPIPICLASLPTSRAASWRG